MQFGINKQEQIFQRLQKIASARRTNCAICSLWKICKRWFIPNCKRKIIWLLVNNIQVTISATLQYFTWQRVNKLLQLCWMKIWHMNSSVKIHSLSPSLCMENEQFFFNCEKHSLLTVELKNLTTKQRRKLPCLWFCCGFLAKCFQVVEKLWAVSNTKKKLFNPELPIMAAWKGYLFLALGI